MHELIESGLEDYLGGSASAEFEAHLIQCEGCRGQVLEMQRASAFLTMLKAPEPIEPRAGFAARVVRNIEDQRKPGFWNVFVGDPGFVRRIAVASLLGIAVLGGYLVSGPTDTMANSDHTPEAVLASHDVSTPNQQKHRDGMLMTLAVYHQ